MKLNKPDKLSSLKRLDNYVFDSVNYKSSDYVNMINKHNKLYKDNYNPAIPMDKPNAMLFYFDTVYESK